MEFTTSFSSLRENWLKFFNGQPLNFRSANRDYLVQQKENWGNSWTGDSGPNMVRYLREGFTVDGLDKEINVIPVRKRRRPQANDNEGDFRYDSFMSGDENCYTRWTNRETIPGISVHFDFVFSCAIKARVIADYTRWLCQVFLSMEAGGIDMDIFAQTTTHGSFRQSYETLDTNIQVKKCGERADYLEWSALFSPGGFRILVFYAMFMAAEKHNMDMAFGMGAPKSGDWGVKWDAENRRLNISCDSRHASEFPADIMTNQLVSALTEARG